MITLRSGPAIAVIDPERGAGVVSLVSEGRALLCTGAGRDPDSPFAQGLNILAPFSNRISGGFPWDGVRHAIPANLSGEPCPIHGDAFQKTWSVGLCSADRVSLSLAGGIGPFRYAGGLSYRLGGDSLSIDLDLTNHADQTLPYGGGFHPWFPRDPETRLSFRASGHWPEDGNHLPASRTPLPLPDDLRFDRPSALPDGWINLGFSGWDGVARIRQPDHDITLTAPGLGTAILYSPGVAAPFFCFEPVSHPVDAHNLPGQPGLRALAPGESLHLALQMQWLHPSDRPDRR